MNKGVATMAGHRIDAQLAGIISKIPPDFAARVLGALGSPGPIEGTALSPENAQGAAEGLNRLKGPSRLPGLPGVFGASVAKARATLRGRVDHAAVGALMLSLVDAGYADTAARIANYLTQAAFRNVERNSQGQFADVRKRGVT